ncbi:MAG: metal ABC transporter substrate-binding protein [Moorellaceae bacterium]
MWGLDGRKKASLLFLIIAIIVIPVLLLATGCSPTESPSRKEVADSQPAPLKIAATIMPLADTARQIGGEKVEVVTVLPPGASPHTYEPTPAQLKALAGSRLILKVGANLDDWIAGAAASSAPGAKVLTVSEGLELLPEEEEHLPPASPAHQPGETGREEKGPAFNPHIWLDPVLMRDHVAPAVAQALAELEPAAADYFMAHLKQWQDKLTQLDAAIRSALAGVPQRTFISFHPAWTYFARRYNLVELEAVEEIPGQEPTAGHLAQLIQKARVQGRPPLLLEPQFSPQAAQVIAQEYGGRLYTVDPVGTNFSSYLDLMYHNLAVFREALGGGGTG